MMIEIAADDSSIEVTEGGSIHALRRGAGYLEIHNSAFIVSGTIVEPEDVVPSDGGLFTLSRTHSGSIRVDPDGGRFALSLQADGGTAEATTVNGSATKSFALSMSFGLETRFHVTEMYNIVRLLDSQMPTGREHISKEGLTLCVVETDSLVLALWSDDRTKAQRLNQAERAVSRHPNGFSLRFSIPAEHRILLSVHDSVDQAAASFREWIISDLGFQPRSNRPASPHWVDDVRLFFTVDMLRSTSEISHDYNDLTKLSAELATLGCPKETVFYIPGWNGPYDAAYPDYRPREELGGVAAFGAMMDAVHGHGFRVMIHTNPWGLDPFHPRIDDLLKYALKDGEGRYAGFQTHSATKWGQWAPKFRKLDFAPGRQRIVITESDDSMSFTTGPIPDLCEALVTIGGLSNTSDRISIGLDERTVRSPEGWFTNTTEYTFPFALRLHPGRNVIRLGGSAEALKKEGAWYRIHDCRVPPDPYATWSYPILFGDTGNDEWIKIVTENIGETVDRYAIDAIHCDATQFGSNGKYYDALRKRLPNTAIGAEGYSTMSSLGYYEFSQSHHNQSLTQYRDTYTGTDFQASLPDWPGLDDSLSWLNKASPLVGFTSEFIRVYPHLCAADAFVPVGKVCTCSDAVKSPREARRLRQILDDAGRLNYIPALRVNYRDYGVDIDTAEYIKSLR